MTILCPSVVSLDDCVRFRLFLREVRFAFIGGVDTKGQYGEVIGIHLGEHDAGVKLVTIDGKIISIDPPYLCLEIVPRGTPVGQVNIYTVPRGNRHCQKRKTSKTWKTRHNGR